MMVFFAIVAGGAQGETGGDMRNLFCGLASKSLCRYVWAFLFEGVCNTPIGSRNQVETSEEWASCVYPLPPGPASPRYRGGEGGEDGGISDHLLNHSPFRSYNCKMTDAVRYEKGQCSGVGGSRTAPTTGWLILYGFLFLLRHSYVR